MEHLRHENELRGRMTKPEVLAREQADKQQRASDVIAKRVGDNILLGLGRPSNLVHIQVKRLWESAYRVNVLIGVLLDATIQHSYFVKTNEEGEIVTTNPRVKRIY